MSYEPVDIVASLDGLDPHDRPNGPAGAQVKEWRDALVAELERRAVSDWREDYEMGMCDAYRQAVRLVKGEAG